VSNTGVIVINDTEKADLLNKTFYDTYIMDDQKKLNLQRRTELENELLNIHVDNKAIEEALNKLSPKTSNTPDGIPSFVLKQVGPAIIPFLNMFSISVYDPVTFLGSGRRLI
jgi:hypothetical protein